MSEPTERDRAAGELTARDRAAGEPSAEGLAARLADPAAFVLIVELAPPRGTTADPKGCSSLACARELASDARIGALSVTDSAGGHPTIAPEALAEEFVGAGPAVIVHVACRDRSRSALQSLGWELLNRGLRNALAVSGDYPAEGYAGLPRPVFDLDSVALLAMYREQGGAAVEGGFTLGAAVNPYKRHERELVPQYLKTEAKLRAGADFLISQAGYDARKADELVRYLRLRGSTVPVVANAYILSRTVARLFHAGAVPGCIVSDELLALVERRAGAPDKGRRSRSRSPGASATAASTCRATGGRPRSGRSSRRRPASGPTTGGPSPGRSASPSRALSTTSR